MSGGIDIGPTPTHGVPLSRTVMVYAGFWWRALAWTVDAVILSVAAGLVRSVTGWSYASMFYGVSTDTLDESGPISHVAWQTAATVATPHLHVHYGAMNLFVIVMSLLYYTLMEASPWQATLGKKLCRLRVCDLQGRRIGIGRAFGRYLGKILSALIALIGYLMAGWTLRKQALHDIMAGTLVTRLRVSDPVFAFNEPPR